MVVLPGQLFYPRQIPACLWFLSRIYKGKRRGKVLFIDARSMENCTHRVLDEPDIQKIADAYHTWQNEKEYKDVLGFCKSVDIKEIRRNGHILVPGRYVGTAPQEEDDEPFEQKLECLVVKWNKQQSEAQRLDKEITINMKNLGFTV